MSSATPMTSRVWEVLLYTSAPTGRSERTASLARSPVSTTLVVIPLRSRASATASISCSEARGENSAMAPSLGPVRAWSPDISVADGVPMSLTTDLGETLVDQRYGHRPFANGGCAPFDRPASDVASGEQPGQIGLERQWLTRQPPSVERIGRCAELGAGAHVPRTVESKAHMGRALRAWLTADAKEQR